jgi:4-diphosphocytidyl-2-C-methyl-D-erythritol kinase
VTLYRCYAKVNLSLEVLRRRTDGYHDLASVAHTISLADDLSIEPADEFLLRAEGFELTLEDNLVDRAARLVATVTQTRLGATVTLVKRIPSAAGLGGGSSDAAATLVGLNALWGTRLGYHRLGSLALQLGSDVPFFLRGGAALMAGRGEELRALPALPAQWLVLVIPPTTLPNKTAALYAALEASDFSDGESTRQVATRLEHTQALDAGALVNAFERPARALFPGLDDVWTEVERRCGRRFCLSGAGPALFGLANDRAEATDIAASLSDAGTVAFAARTVKHARAVARPVLREAKGFSARAPIEYA